MTQLPLVLLFIFCFVFTACSSSQETTSANKEQGKEEIYVFDDPVTDVAVETDSIKTEAVPQLKDTVTFIRDEEPALEETPQNQEYYTVQVGAFTTKDKADTFVKENQKEINYDLKVSYSEKVKLFVVWLPKFSTKQEAENVRNVLWTNQKFKDAFVVTID